MCPGRQREMPICRSFYGSDGTRTRDLRRDRPVQSRRRLTTIGAPSLYPCRVRQFSRLFSGWLREAVSDVCCPFAARPGAPFQEPPRLVWRGRPYGPSNSERRTSAGRRLPKILIVRTTSDGQLPGDDLSVVGFDPARASGLPPTLIVRTGRRSVAIRGFADGAGCVR
jgi:hypothetical protein